MPVGPSYTATETVKDQGPSSPLGKQLRGRIPIARLAKPIWREVQAHE